MSAVTDQYGAKKATESDSESDSEDSEDEDRVGDFLLQMKQEERKAEVKSPQCHFRYKSEMVSEYCRQIPLMQLGEIALSSFIIILVCGRMVFM